MGLSAVWCIFDQFGTLLSGSIAGLGAGLSLLLGALLELLLLFLLFDRRFLILLLLILFVGRHGHVHLELHFGAIGRPRGLTQDLIREENFMDDLVVGPWTVEVLIIHI